jgi:hypothetical protein
MVRGWFIVDLGVNLTSGVVQQLTGLSWPHSDFARGGRILSLLVLSCSALVLFSGAPFSVEPYSVVLPRMPPQARGNPLNALPSVQSTPHFQNGTWNRNYALPQTPSNHWWLIDYWNAWSYFGSFVAMPNSITGLSSGDDVLILPLNVAYGSSTNLEWFQFDIDFNGGANGWPNNIWWGIWNVDAPSGCSVSLPVSNYHPNTIGLTYTVGHAYHYQGSIVGGKFRFEIWDDSVGTNWYKDFTVPSSSQLIESSCFSPASAVEGYTSPANVGNVPYYQFTIGYGMTSFNFYASGSGLPTGLSTDQRNLGGSPNTWHYEMTGGIRVTFNTDPTSFSGSAGSITFSTGASSDTYTNGQSGQYSTGSYTSTANTPPGYRFSGWATTGGLSLSSSTTNPSTVTATDLGAITAIFTTTGEPVSSLGSVLLDAPANTVYFIFPDWNTAHPKPSGVGYDGTVSDWTALGFLYGSLTNMPQVTVPDTNTTYVDPSTGAPKIQNSIIVLFGGPLVNAVVHYYEVNGIAPLHWGLVGGFTSGTEYYYNRTGQPVVSMTVPQIAGGTQDLTLYEVFTDQFGNTVIVFLGLGWKGTFIAGLYFKTVLSNPSVLSSLTDSWYFYYWNDKNGNGFPDWYEVNPTPVNHGN